jgi:PEP-CTERM motif
MKKIWLTCLAVGLTGGAAYADLPTLNGSFAMNPVGKQPNAFGHTSTSLELAATNFITDTEGAFTNLINLDDRVSGYTNLLKSISTSAANPTLVSIPDYLVFSAPFPRFSAPGSTPANRFEFNLSSIYSTGGNYTAFFGTGTVVDAAGVYAPTVAEIALSFSSSAGFTGQNYGLSFSADGVAAQGSNPPSPTPEPGVFALAGFGVAGLTWLRRRK